MPRNDQQHHDGAEELVARTDLEPARRLAPQRVALVDAVVRLSRSAPLRRFGKKVERRLKHILEAGLDIIWPLSQNRALAPDLTVNKLLLVHPNFRIGNTVLTTALIPVLQARFPAARIEYLAGDTAAALLDGLPIDRVHRISRGFLLAPWRAFALLLRLRRARFDLAVDGGMGSYSGALYAFLSGARHRVGFDGRGNRFLTVRFAPTRLEHAYDGAAAFAQALGVSCPSRPRHCALPAEQTTALSTLQAYGMVRNGVVRPFLAAFIGGHLAKRWPQREWAELLGRLLADGVPLLVFIGAEEIAEGTRLQSRMGTDLRVVPLQQLRAFAAMLAHATLLITPDSGPMHLAAALGVPTIALMQRERSRFYVPRGAEDRALFQPRSIDVLAALQEHPRWRLLAPPALTTTE